MEKKKITRFIGLYIFWFCTIAALWLIGEWYLYNQIFYLSTTIAGNAIPSFLVYALFLGIGFASAQYILSPKPITQQPQEQTQQKTSEQQLEQQSNYEPDLAKVFGSTTQESANTEQTENKEATEDMISTTTTATEKPKLKRKSKPKAKKLKKAKKAKK